jgi:hypothetical protein
MTRTQVLVTALLAALLSSGAVAANADPLPIPSIPSIPRLGYIPERPLPLPDPKWPLLPRLAPSFPAIPWIPPLPSNQKDHPYPIPLPPKFHFPEVLAPTPTPLPTTLVLPTCKEILPASASAFLTAEHLDLAVGTIDGRYGIEDQELVTLLTSRDQISCTWLSSISKDSLTISIALLHEPDDSTAILARFNELGYTGSEAIGYGTWDGHHQQYNLIPMPTGPALARLPYWIAVQDNVDGGGTAEPYTIDAQDQFLRLNGIMP